MDSTLREPNLKRINNCPRCGGDLLRFADGLQCLQCSYETDPFKLDLNYRRPAHDTLAQTWRFPGKSKYKPAAISKGK